MCTLNWLTSKHCQGKSSFYTAMPINRWSNRTINFFGDVRLLSHLSEILLPINIEFFHLIICDFHNMDCFNNCSKKRETLLDIQHTIITICESANHFNFITRSCLINVITKYYNLLVSGNPAWKNL